VLGDVVVTTFEVARRGLFIGGGWATARAGWYPVVNPATEEVVAEAPNASVEDVDEAVRAARGAFDAWSRTEPAERAQVLHRAADLAEQRRDEFVPLIQAETGATLAASAAVHFGVMVMRLRRYARGALEVRDQALLPVPIPGAPASNGGLLGAVAARRPVGVVACITPYNFPVGGMAGKIGPALATGSTTVVKPPPQDPLACLLLAEVLGDAGLPPGVVNVVTGAGADVGAALVEHPDVDMVSFTGSSAVGARIAEAGGRTMKRLLLECGGKGGALVLDDADVARAAASVSTTFQFLSGQGCVLPTRAIVHRSIHDRFVDELAGRARSLRVGDPLDADTVLGPVISARQRAHIEGLVRSATEEGARLVTGGERPPEPTGFYVAPTLIADVAPDMTVAQTEAFGPVVCVIPFDDVDAGVAIANSTQYGLNSYVYGADAGRAYGLAARIRSGTVCVNVFQSHPEAPFGGFKMSGLGRDGGSYGLDAYTEPQTVAWA
jgi:acyl-CoA reductase-like NAD-dependent aldehyde dehydrogenase